MYSPLFFRSVIARKRAFHATQNAPFAARYSSAFQARRRIDNGNRDSALVCPDGDGQVAAVVLSTASAGAIRPSRRGTAVIARASLMLFNQAIAFSFAEILKRTVTRAAFSAGHHVAVLVAV